MSLSSTISQYAAKDPAVAVALSDANTKSALLSDMQSNETPTGNLLSDVYQSEANTLLSAASPSHLGQNIDIQA